MCQWLQVDAAVEVEGQMWPVRYTTDARAVAPPQPPQDISAAGLLTMFFDYFACRCASCHVLALPLVACLCLQCYLLQAFER